MSVGVEGQTELSRAPGTEQGSEKTKGMFIRVLGHGKQRQTLASQSREITYIGGRTGRDSQNSRKG